MFALLAFSVCQVSFESSLLSGYCFLRQLGFRCFISAPELLLLCSSLTLNCLSLLVDSDPDLLTSTLRGRPACLELPGLAPPLLVFLLLCLLVCLPLIFLLVFHLLFQLFLALLDSSLPLLVIKLLRKLTIESMFRVQWLSRWNIAS